MNKRFRQYFGIFAAIATYYVVHEGAHLLTALYFGVFKGIHHMGWGIQIDVYADRMTDPQLGIFCLAGPIATLLLGWVLVVTAKRICNMHSKVLKAVMWYITLAVLMLDPLYLSVLCDVFGGGDMNGIRLLLPETAVRIAMALLAVVHGIVIFKYLLPTYERAFRQEG